MKGSISDSASKFTVPGGGSSFSSSGQVAINPTWHPDGLAIFEASNQGGQFRLYYATPGGSAAAEMLNAAKAPGDLTFPSVSPDGMKLAFVSDQTGNGDIRVWDRSTDRSAQITKSVGL